jgi:hypothetical protein
MELAVLASDVMAALERRGIGHTVRWDDAVPVPA